MSVAMPKAEVVLTVYEGFDLTGGGPPFGHIREFRAELAINNKTIVRNRTEGQKLKEFVEQHGEKVGDKERLPYDPGYKSGYKQKFNLATFGAEQIEVLIPEGEVGTYRQKWTDYLGKSLH